MIEWNDLKQELKINYNYYILGNLKYRLFYGGSGLYEGMDTYKYDEYDNVIEYIFFNNDSTMLDTKKYNYKYDDKGNCIEMLEYNDKDIIILKKFIIMMALGIL